jgi:hypothetical protein
MKENQQVKDISVLFYPTALDGTVEHTVKHSVSKNGITFTLQAMDNNITAESFIIRVEAYDTGNPSINMEVLRFTYVDDDSKSLYDLKYMYRLQSD